MKHIATIILFALCATKMFAQNAEVIEIQSLSPPETILNFGTGDKNIAIVAIHYSQNAKTQTSEQLFILDSLIVNAIANNIKERLEESPIFENFDIPVYNLYSDSAMIGEKMQKEELVAISEQSGAKIVVAIEFVDIKSNYIIEKDKKPLVTNVDFNVLINAYDVETGDNVSEYTRKSNIMIPAFYDDDGTYIAPPQREDARRITAETIGRDYARQISPTWETVERIIFYDSYYDGKNSNFGKGYNSAVNQEDWATAADYWTDALVENMTKLKKAQAMYNIAVACEMLEKTDLSLRWLEKAKDLKTRINDNVVEYENILKQRIEDKEKLDKVLE